MKNKWKHLRDNIRGELNRMNASKSGDPGLSPSKRESQWWWLNVLLFLKNTSNATKMESNVQLQSKQLDRESTEPEKDSCTSIDDDFAAGCSSADNSIHTPAPSETSRSSAQRRTRPSSGKRPLEEAMIETERKKLDLMQSMGNGREEWDTTYHFLMSLWEPIKRLSEHRQMFLRMKFQEMIFRETQKQIGTQNSTSSSQMQLFNYEDGRSNQGESGQHLTAQSFFPEFQRMTIVLYSKLLVFPIIQHPTICCGFLIIALFKFTIIEGH